MKEKQVVITGAGPGGLTSAMILAKRGFKVSVYEQEAAIGGRNGSLKTGPYIHDIGPTFLMMTFILREMFEEAGRKAEDYLKIVPLDPMYKLSFIDKEIFPTANEDRMREQIARLFPGNEHGLERFQSREKVRYEKMYPCLQKDYSTIGSLFSGPLVKALPHLSLSKTLYQTLGNYFKDEQLKISFTFQAKYLGMSPGGLYNYPLYRAYVWYRPHHWRTYRDFGSHGKGGQGTRGGHSSVAEGKEGDCTQWSRFRCGT
jgi:phytoene desaturase